MFSIIKKKMKFATAITVWVGIFMFIMSFIIAVFLKKNLKSFYFDGYYMFYEILLILLVLFCITFIFYSDKNDADDADTD